MVIYIPAPSVYCESGAPPIESLPTNPVAPTNRLNPAALRLLAMRFLDSGLGRLARFAVVGGATGLVQLIMLELLKAVGLGAVVAYALGLIISLQFNFCLSTLLIWGDRPVGSDRSRALVKRWVTYHACVGLAVAINFGIFVVARGYMPDLAAAVVAVMGSTLVKFVSLDRLAFKAGTIST